MKISSLFRIAALTVLLAFGTACATTGTTPKAVSHPGAINTFDSTTYDILVSAQAAIDKAKMLVPSTPAIKSPLNAVIKAYNPAEAAWQIYHGSGGLKGDAASLQALIDALKAALVPLTQMLGGKP